MRIGSPLIALLLLLSSVVSSASGDSLDEIRQRGTLRWGGDASGGGPYIYQGADGKLVGFEWELAEYLARELGVRPEYVNWEWENLPLILDTHKIDLVLNGFEWSEEREQLWASTNPYYVYKLQLMARADDDSIKSWDDLRAKPGEPRKKVGVLQGAASERVFGVAFRRFDRTQEVSRDHQRDGPRRAGAA